MFYQKFVRLQAMVARNADTIGTLSVIMVLFIVIITGGDFKS